MPRGSSLCEGMEEGCCTQPFPCICKEAVSGFEPMTNKSPRHNFFFFSQLDSFINTSTQESIEMHIIVIMWNKIFWLILYNSFKDLLKACQILHSSFLDLNQNSNNYLQNSATARSNLTQYFLNHLTARPTLLETRVGILIFVVRLTKPCVHFREHLKIHLTGNYHKKMEWINSMGMYIPKEEKKSKIQNIKVSK